MAEHTQLFVLENKLKKMRIYRKISTFIAGIPFFIVAVTMTIHWHPVYGGIIGFIVGFVLSAISNKYFSMKEKQVLEQIEKLRLWKGYR